MHFSDVIGQQKVKQQLQRMLNEERMPHALLFAGPEGTGKLPMALALAQRLLCKAPRPDGEPCGSCQSCCMAAQYAHPDLHCFYPVFKPAGQSSGALSDLFLPQWREQLKETAYFSREEWLKRIGVENQQSLINVAEAVKILKSLSTVSNISGKKVVVMWLAEQLNQEASNKLLKIIEEPPKDAFFIFTSNHPERLLPTVLSRLQRIDFAPLSVDDISHALQSHAGLQPDDAGYVARAAAGSYIQAQHLVTAQADTAQYFDMFVLLMRLSYQRKIKDLYEWAQQVSQWGRERQKAFLEYCQHLLRENFVYNFRRPELNYQNRPEAEFSVRFARFINERNVIGIMDELSAAQRDIEQNVNARMVFFDFTLKMIVLLIQ